MKVKALPIDVHAAIELLAAPLLIVAPFALGFSVTAGVVSIALGALLIALAVSALDGQNGRGMVPLASHESFDYAIAGFTGLTGILTAIGTGEAAPALFLVGFAVAHVALAAGTRYSRPARLSRA